MEGAAVIYTNKASNGDLNGVHFSIDSSAEDDTITSTDSTPKYTGRLSLLCFLLDLMYICILSGAK